jgi:hypothetical protein
MVCDTVLALAICRPLAGYREQRMTASAERMYAFHALERINLPVMDRAVECSIIA